MKSKAKANLSKLIEKFEHELTTKGSLKDQIQRQIEKIDREIDNLFINYTTSPKRIGK